MSDGSLLHRHTFLLRLNDRPGGMELIAATFAHRGISLTATLGNDGTLDPSGRATVLVTFTSTEARKEALKLALSRLSRLVSLIEEPDDAPETRIAALVRLQPDAPAPVLNGAGSVEVVHRDPDTGEIIYSLLGAPEPVGETLDQLRASGALRAVTYTMLAV
jgi:hypothetical protein